jgi:rRNA maturation RNase YbeY
LALLFHNADHPFRCPQRKKIRAWIHDFAAHHGKRIGEVSIVFCSDEYLLEVNKSHLNHDYYTDIITFDYCEGDVISGDLMLSVDRIKDNAKTHNQLFFNELIRVIVHGHLHLVGYKDKTKSDAQAMRSQEDLWIERFHQFES